ncbi:MAG: extracellular solute-binding protein family 5 [Fibrobacteres bacterium]|nr:extracellular solute-binding protein family 5 [Fibrobacterota bacterium]
MSLGAYGLWYCAMCADPSNPSNKAVSAGLPTAATGTDAAPGSEPQQGEIVLRIPSWPMQSLDPTVWKPELVLIQGTVAEGLFGYDKDMNIVPKVAESWTMSPDKLIWTFKLRHDKRWSNGDTVTAHDFIYAWTRFCSPETPSETWASIFPAVYKAMEFKGGTSPIDSVGFKALDAFTVQMKLSRPKALPSLLAMGSAMPLNRKGYEAAKKEGEGDLWCMPGHFVGNGPYLPKSFIRDGEVELVKNPLYVGECGNVDRFILKAMNMSSQNVQIQQYEAGELDIAHVLTLGDYAYATKAGHLKNQVNRTPEIGFLGVQMAHTVNKLMSDPDLRKAIALALDRSEIADNVMGGRVVPTFVPGPPQDTLFKGLTIKPRNVDEAKRLLAKSTYKGEIIYLFTPPATDVQGLAMVSEAVQSQLKAIGLNVVIENMEQDLLTGALASYVWGGGYMKDARFTRPGLTLFPGKVLWKEPVMMTRGADHVWYWMCFNYELKELRKRITLERIDIKNEMKGDKPEDWKELIPLKDSAHVWFKRIKEIEKDPIYRDKIAETDPADEYDRVLATITPKTPKADAIAKWQQVKDRILEGHFNFLTYLLNGAGNNDGSRMLADVESMTLDDPQVTEVSRKLIQHTMDQDWIIPLVSENLVYLKRPFISGETIYKLGVWNMMFNLSLINVDKDAYFHKTNLAAAEAPAKAR